MHFSRNPKLRPTLMRPPPEWPQYGPGPVWRIAEMLVLVLLTIALLHEPAN
jgi:hypothetical protein